MRIDGRNEVTKERREVMRTDKLRRKLKKMKSLKRQGRGAGVKEKMKELNL